MQNKTTDSSCAGALIVGIVVGVAIVVIPAVIVLGQPAAGGALAAAGAKLLTRALAGDRGGCP